MEAPAVCSAFVFVLITLQMATVQAESPCVSVKQNVAWVPHPTDCQGFFICAFNMAIPLRCGEGTVWQPEKKVCCMKGSTMDTCTVKSLPPKPKALSGLTEEPEDPKTCKPGMTSMLPHPKHCARYMDCASQGTVHGLREDQVRECPHPQLFNPKTGVCDHYDNVDCLGKESPKEACDYEMNKCQRSHCIPCYVRYPSCKGMSDGKQIWKGRGKSPFYAECKNQRVIKHGRCKSAQLFSANSRACVDASSVALS